MKLTIDIPEKIYLNAKEDLLCGGDILVKAIKNGTPYETITEFADRCRECGREKVLDKIRAEIIEACGYSKDYVGTFDYSTTYLKIVLQIIDKYKTESEDKE